MLISPVQIAVFAAVRCCAGDGMCLIPEIKPLLRGGAPALDERADAR